MSSTTAVIVPVALAAGVITVAHAGKGELPTVREIGSVVFVGFAASLVASAAPATGEGLAWLLFVAVLLSQGKPALAAASKLGTSRTPARRIPTAAA